MTGGLVTTTSLPPMADIKPIDPVTAALALKTDTEESEEARIERLGRQRPDELATAWVEAGFCFSIVMSQLINEYFISGFNVLIPTVVDALNISPASVTWPASAFSLVVSAFLLPFGRLADIHGAYKVYLAGNIWMIVWSLIAGFAQNELMLDFSRAMQGLGSAAYLPASMTLLGKMYRPGPRKNFVFSLYGVVASLGLYVGIFFAGVSAQYAGWRWYFFIGAILTALSTIAAALSIPKDKVGEDRPQMDWLGSLTIAGGLILVVFAITDCSHAPNGWKSPYIPITLAAGLLLLAAAVYIEGWVAKQPILPADLFKIKYMTPLIAGLIPAYATFGIFLLYATLYAQNIMGIGPMLLVAWFTPLGLGGCILAMVGGLIMHRVPGTWLAIMTGVAIIIDSLLFALAPDGANYWAWFFSAFLCATIAIDIIFNVANVYFTTVLPSRQQGLAGALANVLLQLSIALGLGFADVVASATAWQGEKQSYKNIFWFELACGATALFIFAFFVRLDSAISALTADEREQQAKEGSA